MTNICCLGVGNGSVHATEVELILAYEIGSRLTSAPPSRFLAGRVVQRPAEGVLQGSHSVRARLARSYFMRPKRNTERQVLLHAYF